MSKGELYKRLNEPFKDYRKKKKPFYLKDEVFGEGKKFWQLNYGEVMKVLDEAKQDCPFDITDSKIASLKAFINGCDEKDLSGSAEAFLEGILWIKKWFGDAEK